MPTITPLRVASREDEIVLSESEIGEQIKYHEEKIRLLQEKRTLARKLAKLNQRLSEGRTPRRQNPTPVARSAKTTVRSLREEMRALKSTLPPRFTSADILQKLRNYPFTSEPKSAVRDALYEMTKMGELRVVIPGKAGKPNTLEWAQTSKVTA